MVVSLIIKRYIHLLLVLIWIFPATSSERPGTGKSISIEPGIGVGGFIIGDSIQEIKRKYRIIKPDKVHRITMHADTQMVYSYNSLGILCYFGYHDRQLKKIDILTPRLLLENKSIHVGSKIKEARNIFGDKDTTKTYKDYKEWRYEQYGISFWTTKNGATIIKISIYQKIIPMIDPFSNIQQNQN